MKNYIFTLLFLAVSFTIFAQKRPAGQGGGRNFDPNSLPAIGKIYGTVVDQQTQKPLEFATVSLIRLMRGDSTKLETGVITDDKGTFLLEQVKVGRFRLKIEFIGYKPYFSDTLIVTPRTPEHSLGKIQVGVDAKQLQAVEVVGEKATYESNLDKKIFNVGKNITATGGTVTDVLQNVPSVSVDIDGNVALRGSSNVTVLIDGKPSGLTGANRQAALSQLPASAVEKIEVITNPSARYDADGMSGIINIVTKKDKLEGLNGNATVGIGTRNKYNASANLNYRVKKFNVFGNYSYRFDQRYGEGYSNRQNIFTDTTWHLNQNNYSENKPQFHLGKIGLDYFLNPKNTISASVSYGNRNSVEEERLKYQFLTANKLLDSLYYRDNYNSNNGNNIDAAINYRKTFDKPQKEWTADVTYSRSEGNSYGKFSQQTYHLNNTPRLTEKPLQQSNTGANAIHLLTVQTDFTQPVGKKGKLEMGYKSIFRNIDTDFSIANFNYASNQWEKNLLLSNRFRYNESVNAAYVMLGNEWKGFAYQIGLRGEQTFSSSKTDGIDKTFDNQYFNIFPSAYITRNLGKEQEIFISFSRRINRPNVQSLNPFIDYSDPLNIRVGNPQLMPEYINSYEIGYNKAWKIVSLNSTIYYRNTSNVISRVRTVDNTGVSTITFKNLATAESYGIELVARIQPTNWWDITISGNTFQNTINGSNIDADLNNSTFTWNGKILSNVRFWKNAAVQLSGSYNAPFATPQGKTIAFYAVDLGFKKDISPKATITLNVSDIFDWRQFGINQATSTFNADFIRKRESRVATLSFTYKFGGKDFAPSRRKNSKGNEGGMEGGGGADF
jgi:outer membrane receptor protein involved in Fe transport